MYGAQRNKAPPARGQVHIPLLLHMNDFLSWRAGGVGHRHGGFGLIREVDRCVSQRNAIGVGKSPIELDRMLSQALMKGHVGADACSRVPRTQLGHITLGMVCQRFETTQYSGIASVCRLSGSAAAGCKSSYCDGTGFYTRQERSGRALLDRMSCIRR